MKEKVIYDREWKRTIEERDDESAELDMDDQGKETEMNRLREELKRINKETLEHIQKGKISSP